MRELSKAKWFTASCGIACLAIFLALSHNLPGKETTRIGGLSRNSGVLRKSSAPILTAASAKNVNIIKRYGQLPLAFEPNSSPSTTQAQFLARGNGYALFLAKNEAVLELRGQSKTSAVLRMELAGRTLAPPSSRFKIDPFDMLRHFSGTWLVWLIALFMILTVALLRRRPMTAAFGFAVVLLLVSAACGAGGSPPGVPAGTPAGTYQITITGTSGSSTTSTPVTLQVN